MEGASKAQVEINWKAEDEGLAEVTRLWKKMRLAEETEEKLHSICCSWSDTTENDLKKLFFSNDLQIQLGSAFIMLLWLSLIHTIHLGRKH